MTYIIIEWHVNSFFRSCTRDLFVDMRGYETAVPAAYKIKFFVCKASFQQLRKFYFRFTDGHN